MFLCYEDVVVPEKSPPRICYVYPESEDLPHYNPEKIVDATIDTSAQFIGFKLNSDTLVSLLQEALDGDLAPIAEISSFEVICNRIQNYLITANLFN